MYVFPEGGKGFGTAVVATHAKFDVTFFPARRNNQRVRNSFATLPARLNEKGVTDDLADITDVVSTPTTTPMMTHSKSSSWQMLLLPTTLLKY